MPGHLDHSPADILRYLMINHGIGTLPPTGTPVTKSDWQIFVSTEPDRLDNTITVYNTVGRQFGRTQVDREIQEMHGVQIRVRASIPEQGYPKARVIAIELDENVYQELVTIGTATYCVHSFTRVTDIRDIGKDASTSTKRHIHTFDGLLVVTQKILGTGTYY